MTLPARILSRVAVVRTEYAPGGEYRTTVSVCWAGAVRESGWDGVAWLPVVVVVCGHGVATRADDSDVAARVRADDETFVWNSSAGRTSFVRRERLQGLLQELTARKIVPVRLVCLEEGADFPAAVVALAEQFRESLRWSALLRPTDEGSALAQALVRRLALPVLGAFLLLLMANALLAPRLNSRRQQLHTTLASREATCSASATASVRQRQLLGEFYAREAVPRAVVCDRIGRVVPEGVRLTSLDVEPLSQRFEAGKPLERREGVAVVCGLASAADGLSSFVQRLSQTGCCRDVQLTGVEKERGTGDLAFRIELRL